MDVEPLVGGSVEVYYSVRSEAIQNPSHESWTRIKRITAGFDDTEAIIGKSSRYIAVKVVLYSNDVHTVTPRFRSFTTRALPGAGDIILTLPVNVSDQVEIPGRQRMTIPGVGRLVYDSLKSIEGRSVFVELFDPNERIRGMVEAVETAVPLLTIRGSRTLTSMVRIRGRRTGLLEASTVIGPPATYHLPATLPTPADVI